MIYNKVVEDCFFRLTHAGLIDLNLPLSAYVRSSQKNQSLTIIELYMQCNSETVISRACFKATGNPYAIASLEWLCRRVEGKNLNSLPIINYQILVKELAIPTAHVPIAIQVDEVYKEVLAMMIKKIEGIL